MKLRVLIALLIGVFLIGGLSVACSSENGGNQTRQASREVLPHYYLENVDDYRYEVRVTDNNRWKLSLYTDVEPECLDLSCRAISVENYRREGHYKDVGDPRFGLSEIHVGDQDTSAEIFQKY